MNRRQLFDPLSSTYSYLLWDEDSREAALIDPVRDQYERDVQLVKELQLDLVYALDTHIHADHSSGIGNLREACGSLIGRHFNSQTDDVDLLIEDGDYLPLGNQNLEVLFTPGHTDTDVSFLADGCVFTGDTLMIQGCGRTDFETGDAGRLYDSIVNRLFVLPANTLVFPAHDYSARCCTSIGQELDSNPCINANTSRQEFVEQMLALDLDLPAQIQEACLAGRRSGLYAS